MQGGGESNTVWCKSAVDGKTAKTALEGAKPQQAIRDCLRGYTFITQYIWVAKSGNRGKFRADRLSEESGLGN